MQTLNEDNLILNCEPSSSQVISNSSKFEKSAGANSFVFERKTKQPFRAGIKPHVNSININNRDEGNVNNRSFSSMGMAIDNNYNITNIYNSNISDENKSQNNQSKN